MKTIKEHDLLRPFIACVPPHFLFLMHGFTPYKIRIIQLNTITLLLMFVLNYIKEGKLRKKKIKTRFKQKIYDLFLDAHRAIEYESHMFPSCSVTLFR